MRSLRVSFFSKIQNNHGMTLTELLVATGLSSVAMVLMATVMVETTNLSKSFEVRARDEVERLTAERQLRGVFLQAVDLPFKGNVDINASPGSGLREYDSDVAWSLPGPSTQTLAVFWRDVRVSAVPPALASGLSTNFLATGIFFQKPTAKTWGVLYIDLGGPGLTTVAPDRSDLIFEGLVGLKVKNVQTFLKQTTATAIGSPVTSFDVEMTFRKFINPKGQADFVYCPRSVLVAGTDPACQDKTPSRDVIRTIRILVRDNTLTVSPSSPLATPIGARAYDLVHFFKPYTPSGLL